MVSVIVHHDHQINCSPVFSSLEGQQPTSQWSNPRASRQEKLWRNNNVQLIVTISSQFSDIPFASLPVQKSAPHSIIVILIITILPNTDHMFRIFRIFMILRNPCYLTTSIYLECHWQLKTHLLLRQWPVDTNALRRDCLCLIHHNHHLHQDCHPMIVITWE